jgi:hypothetical protein
MHPATQTGVHPTTVFGAELIYSSCGSRTAHHAKQNTAVSFVNSINTELQVAQNEKASITITDTSI